MVKKYALCIGCNYPSKAFGLTGAVNDCFLIADLLQKHYDFQPDNVLILHDVYPGQKKSMKVDPQKQPTRRNILAGANWLARSAKPGDVIFFSFSGYGLQVDDMQGQPDEGLHEAILPTDFVDGVDGDYSVIVTSELHDMLLGVPSSCTVTVIMDCDHASSILDVGATLDGEPMAGIKYQTFCGLKAHTSKMQLAEHNKDVWQEDRARAVKARPRFQPMMEIDNPRKGKLPTREGMCRTSPVAFAYTAAGNGQTAMEMLMPAVGPDGEEQQRPHGVLSWSFVRAAEELRFDCTHADLARSIKRQITRIRDRDLPRMDQELKFTFSTPNASPGSMKVLEAGVPATGSRPALTTENRPLAPFQVVPPPKRGDMDVQAAPSPGTGGTSFGPGREREVAAAPGEAWPPLPVPPPPPPAPPRRVAAEVAHHDVVPWDRAWPPLPAPPPPPPPPAPQRRVASELVHHNVVADQDRGSFAVQGGFPEPPWFATSRQSFPVQPGGHGVYAPQSGPRQVWAGGALR